MPMRDALPRDCEQYRREILGDQHPHNTPDHTVSCDTCAEWTLDCWSKANLRELRQLFDNTENLAAKNV